jgi:glycosyltransferase involved in cell wall biosynthesis
LTERCSRGLDEVDVVIPSRDRWRHLRTALASALAQTHVDLGVIVIDDGSVDRTAAELAALHDDRVRVLHHERPQGVSAARNLGLAHVTARWVAFLDDDDVWAPGHLAAMLEAVRASRLDRERVGLVFSGHLDIDSDRQVTNVSHAPPAESVRAGLERMNVIGCPSRVVLRTDAVRDVGAFDVRLSIIADWDLWLRVAAEHAVVRCPEMLVGYMHHPGNMHLDAERLVTELTALHEKHGWNAGERGDAVFGDLLAGVIAATYRANGRRVRAARWYLRSFGQRRRARDLGRAVGVLLGERLISLSGLRHRPTIDPSVGQWLEAVRQAERAPTTSLPPLPGLHGGSAAT